MATEVLIKGRVSRARPQPDVDGGRDGEPLRLDQYGEQYVMSMSAKQHWLADEGSYGVLTNPTPGTALATIAAQSSLADTAPFILGKNDNEASAGAPGKRCYLDYLKLICGAAGTAGASVRYAVKVDGQGANRYTSGSGLATAPALGVNPNRDSQQSDGMKWYAGAVVAAAASDARLVAHGLLRTVIPVVGDTYLINFGGHENALSSMAQAGAAIAQVVAPAPPVIFGPQQWVQLHLWLPSQSAASSWEFELGYWVR